MKLICDGLDLSDAINKVSRALPQKAVNPILEGIKITAKNNQVTLFGADAEISIQKTIKAEITEEGEILVPGKFLGEYVRKLTNQQIELFNNEKNQLRIKYGDNEGFIQLLDKTDYPYTVKEKGSDKITILQRDLKDTIEKTIFAVSQDDSRPVLKGCFMEFNGLCLTTVALDGYRMALNKKTLTEKTEYKKVIIPSRSLNEIAKLLESNDEQAQIYIDEKYSIFKLKDMEISTHMINGEYINYKQLLPEEYETNVVINKNQFEESLDRASLPSRQEKNNLVKLEIRESVMTIKGTSEMSNIKENVSISLKGKDLNIAFNARYIADCLRVLENEFVKINFTSSVSPSTITPCDSDDCLYLVLPVRLVG